MQRSPVTISRGAPLLNLDRRRRRVLQRRLQSVLAHVPLLALSAVFIIPLVWMVSTSLKADRQIFAWPPVWIPNPVVWMNYPRVFEYAPFLLYLRNTLVIAAANVIGPVLACSLAAYAFARLRAPGRNAIFMVLLGTMMVPGVVTMVPLYIVFSKLRWINTLLPLTVPSLLGSPFYIFLLRQFFLTLPSELEEAARIDSAGYLRIWWSIILPLAQPALATVAIFGFIGAWNDFMGPLIYLNDQRLYTLALGLQSFQTEHTAQWGYLMAAATMMTLPLIIVFFVAQKQFIQGITLTGLKG